MREFLLYSHYKNTYIVEIVVKTSISKMLQLLFFDHFLSVKFNKIFLSVSPFYHHGTREKKKQEVHEPHGSNEKKNSNKQA